MNVRRTWVDRALIMAEHDMAMSDCVWDMGDAASERRMISVRSVMLWLSELEGVRVVSGCDSWG